MNDQQLELQIRDWFAVEIDENVVAPAALRASVAAIPGQARDVRAIDRRWLLLAAAALLLVALGAVIAIGSEVLRREAEPFPTPSLTAPSEPPPSLAIAPPSNIIDAATTTAYSFATGPTPDLLAVVDGPDGAPYVLDRATKAVYRVDVAASNATAVLRAGQDVDGSTVGEPRLVAVAGDDLLILDRQNTLWSWRPSGTRGDGSLTRPELNGATAFGDDVAAMATFCRNAPDCSLNNLYLVDPSERMIRAFMPSADGSDYPATATDWLQAPRDMAAVSAMYVDGDLFLVDGGAIVRFTGGAPTDWQAQPSGDGQPPQTPAYRYIVSASGRQEGRLYALDVANERLVALEKATGRFVDQYRPGNGFSFADLRGLDLRSETDAGASALWWIDRSNLNLSTLPGPAARSSPSLPAAESPPASP